MRLSTPWERCDIFYLICVNKDFKVSMEGHNYEQAIADFEDCLSKRTAALPAGSRLVFFSSLPEV